MPKFDFKTFARVTGQGGGFLDALGTSFGVPSCMTQLTKDLLSILPSPVLASTYSKLLNGREAADDVMKNVTKALTFNTGIIEYNSGDGTLRFVSDSSRLKSDQDEGEESAGIGDLLAGVNEAIQFGTSLYNNVNATIDQLRDIAACFGSFKATLDFAGASSRELLTEEQLNEVVNSEYAAAVQQAEQARQFVVDSTEVLETIDSILLERLNNPELEPSNDIETLPDQLEEIFRLEAGPPSAKRGKFILSIDGLYFDSQTSGVIPILNEVARRRDDYLEPTTLWRLEHDPNLGGKGTPTSINELKSYFNTILDPDVVDDSESLKEYYNKDILLQNLIGQKNRRLYDVSSDLTYQVSSGASQAVIANTRQVLISESSRYIEKINKRKKQIELAVKLPILQNSPTRYTPGNVPINDFSYLEGINFLLSLQNQRKLAIGQSEVEGVVLPIKTKYTQQIESPDPLVLNHLFINNIGKASIIDDAPASSAPSISLNAQITEDGLFGLYNFLTVESGKTYSDNYGVFNGFTNGTEYNSKLIGDVSSVFSLGLGVPYFSGVALLNNTDTSYASSTGSFMRLPEKPEFQDLFYSRDGTTIETWVHIPSFSAYNIGSEASGLYRLILANENTGIVDTVSAQPDIHNLTRDFGTTTTNGLIYGFTRDRRFTQKLMPSNLDAENPYSDSVLLLAVTQAFDNSSVGFIANRTSGCDSTSSWYGMTVSVSSVLNGKSLSSCEDEFCHLVLTVSPKNNEVNVYLDSVNIATSSYADVFGSKNIISVPTAYQASSFRYDSTHVDPRSDTQLKYGPSLDNMFTPWIVGGGYTDGNPNGNFMGGEYGGKISGLKGYLGGIKFYSRALSQSEVYSNYQVTQNFFKNIDITEDNY